MRSSLTTVLLLLLLASVVFESSFARADSIARPTKSKAQEHFKRGNALYQLREFEKAVEEYRAGMLEQDLPVFSFNLAQCYRQIGRYEDAIWHYERFLGRAAQVPGEMEASIKKHLAEMKSALATRAAARAAIEVAAAQPLLPLETPPQHQARDVGHNSRRTVPLVVIGAGVAAVVTGGIVFALDEDAPEVGRLAPTHRNTAAHGIAIAAVGAVTIGVGTWLWWRGSRSAPLVAVTSSDMLVGWTSTF